MTNDDLLRYAAEQLIASVPEFASSDYLVPGECDESTPYMLFEDFGRFMVERVQAKTIDTAVLAGLDLINQLIEHSDPEVVNMVVVTVLEYFASQDISMRKAVLPFLGEEARQALQELLDVYFVPDEER